jgi:hypothetical protein
MVWSLAADGDVRVGMAYSPSALAFSRAHPGLLDYLEIPFEQLRHDPSVVAIGDEIPLVLHCASLSVAGFVPPTDALVAAVAAATEGTRTPWVGEHLAFLSADTLDAEEGAHPTQLGYTVTPQYSEEVLGQVVANLDRLKDRIPAPLIVENSPQYLNLPGSTMTMVEFIAALARASDVGLLLDLSHFAITGHNLRHDIDASLDAYPVERVIEVHMSGHSIQSGIMWDDHARAAPEASFKLLHRVLERARPRAITFEYNWGDRFPPKIVAAHIGRARDMVAQA